MLALGGPEEAFQWLLSQLLRYSFCGIYGNEMEGLLLITQGQKSFFPHWPALHQLFCYHLYWCGDTWKGHLSTSSYWSYCGQEYTQGHAQALRWQIFPPAVLTWEAFWKVTLIALWVSSEASKVLMVRNWTSVWKAIWSTPVYLHFISKQGGTSTEPVSVRGRLSLTREGKLQCKVCLHLHLEQGGMPPVERWQWSLLFSVTDRSEQFQLHSFELYPEKLG